MLRFHVHGSDELGPMEEGTLLEGNAAFHLFSGPHDLAATAAKYMYSFREAEETDVSVKRARMVHSGSFVSSTVLFPFYCSPERVSPFTEALARALYVCWWSWKIRWWCQWFMHGSVCIRCEHRFPSVL